MISKMMAVMQKASPPEQPWEDFIVFEMSDEDSGEVTRSIMIHNDDVRDMGGPEFITVTTEPWNTIPQDDVTP